ncbi:MAG: N-acetylmuramoyl-L-alanine amidase [Bacteroidetes bacterium]|nr:N-acetylmuramoyl-L-alanine amidase [Bacteroidota bacterium]
MIFLIYIIKMTLISGLLYSYYWFFLRNKRFHLYNRFYLLSIPVIAAILPLLKIPLPFAGIIGDNNAIHLLRVSSGDWEDAVTITAHKNFLQIFLNWQNLGFCIYASGIIILLISFFRSLSYIIKIAKRYPVEHINDIYFFQTNEPGTPFSFFKQIFWNRKLNIESAEGQQIFRHELYHVRQKHSADILMLEFVTMLTWFNPFIYLIKREIKAIHEFLADEYAISDNNRYAYAELLITQSIRHKQSQMLNPFFHNQIKRRITMITKFKNPKNNYLSRLMILPVLFILFCAFAIKTSHKNLFIPKAKTITVVIDAGHGGIDPGANNGRVYEKDIALKISKKIQELSKDYNVHVVMTREKDELPGGANSIKEGLENRTNIAVKNKADLFVSIHLNNTTNSTESGFAFYIADNDTELSGKNVKLGSILSEEIKKDYGVANEITKVNHGVAVLTHSSIPAIIVECGFISNTKDLSYISDEKNQETIAKDILDGIVKFSQTNTSILNSNISQHGGDTLSPMEMIKPEDIKEISVLEDKKTVKVKLKNGDSVFVKDVAFKTTPQPKQPIFTKVEIEPEFPGGQDAWKNYLVKNLHYPNAAVNKEIQGDVLAQFVVDMEGNVSDIKIVSGPEELRAETIRIIRESGKWVPAMQNGKNVTCYKRQPIKYRLERQG